MLSNFTSRLMCFSHALPSQMYLPSRPLHEKQSTASTALTLEAEDGKNSIFCLTGMLIISTKEALASTAF